MKSNNTIDLGKKKSSNIHTNPIMINIENKGPFLPFPFYPKKFPQTYQTLLHI